MPAACIALGQAFDAKRIDHESCVDDIAATSSAPSATNRGGGRGAGRRVSVSASSDPRRSAQLRGNQQPAPAGEPAGWKNGTAAHRPAAPEKFQREGVSDQREQADGADGRRRDFAHPYLKASTRQRHRQAGRKAEREQRSKTRRCRYTPALPPGGAGAGWDFWFRQTGWCGEVLKKVLARFGWPQKNWSPARRNDYVGVHRRQRSANGHAHDRLGGRPVFREA